MSNLQSDSQQRKRSQSVGWRKLLGLFSQHLWGGISNSLSSLDSPSTGERLIKWSKFINKGYRDALGAEAHATWGEAKVTVFV